MPSDVNSGLEGVVAAETTISLVDGQAGRLLYRGY
jgi:citrate synthase